MPPKAAAIAECKRKWKVIILFFEAFVCEDYNAQGFQVLISDSSSFSLDEKCSKGIFKIERINRLNINRYFSPFEIRTPGLVALKRPHVCYSVDVYEPQILCH